MDKRSFHFKEKKLPICARCTGELLGIFLGLISSFYFKISIISSIIFLLPMIVDGGIQISTSYESSNTKRLITGTLFGYGLSTLFIISTVVTFNYGKTLV